MRASNFVLNSFICKVLIRCLCENLLLDDVMNIFKKMIDCDIKPSYNVFLDMINVFCKLGKINEALEFLEDKCVYETSPHNCCRAGKFSLAKGRLEKMYERNIANCDSWNILIRWLCKNARIRKAFEPLGKMIVFSCIPDCATYLALVIGNCRLNRYGDALKLFHKIRANCWVLDAISYSELVEGLC
jgi:pentatricopeptide repeat protein